jgi:hypothetical protein
MGYTTPVVLFEIPILQNLDHPVIRGRLHVMASWLRLLRHDVHCLVRNQSASTIPRICMETKPASHPPDSGAPANDWTKHRKDVDTSEPFLLLPWVQLQIIPGWTCSTLMLLFTANTSTSGESSSRGCSSQTRAWF